MKNYPLVKYVIAFIIGIAFNNYFAISSYYIISFEIILLLIIVIFNRISFIKNNRVLLNLLLLLFVVVLGNHYAGFRDSKAVTYPFKSTKINSVTLWGKVKSVSLISNNKFKIILESDSLEVKNSISKLENNILCNISLKDKSKLLALFDVIGIGNRVKIKGVLRKGRGERNPGEFDYYKYLQSKNISALFNVYNASDFSFTNREVDIVANTILSVRKSISKLIGKYHNKQTGALLKGLLLADRSEIDFRTKESFINSGVIHVLAVSGLHVGFIVLIFSFLFSRVPPFPRIVFTLMGLVAFLIITNSPPSVFRATIMIFVMLLIFLSNRDYNSINALAIAALILLLINPSDLFNPGFQLSFSAVLSILIIYPILSQKIKTKNKVLRYLLLFTAVSFSAQIGTLPFTLIYFNKLSVISILTNLFVIPLIGVIVGLAVVTLTVSISSSTVALYFASSNMLITDLMLSVIGIAGKYEYSHLFISNFSILDGILFYLFLFVVLLSSKMFQSIKAFLLLLILVGFNLFFYLSLDNKELFPKNEFSLMLVDIGQGDGILLKFPNGETALIDAGNASFAFDNGERVIRPLLKRLGISKIDYGFITHVDSDHYKGFISLISNGLIKRIFKPRIDTTLSKDVNLEYIISKSGSPLEYYSKSKMDFGNLSFYILNDTTNAIYNKLDMNNRSGIFKIVYGNNSFLLTGDAEYAAERFLIKEYGPFLDSDILKVGHHGSKSSSSQKFIDAVTPKIALISVGENNKFNHPSKIVIDRFNNKNVAIYRTDLEGAIILQSDGESINKIDWRDF